MYYGAIKSCDIANGEGVRVSLFVSGCRHGCKNCFNPETWNFSYGTPYTKQTTEQILKLLEPSYVQGLTLLGGEPMEPENQPVLLELVQAVRKTYGKSKDIWCYTGCILETELLSPGSYRGEVTDALLQEIDVLVDGPFIESQKSLSLPFRGSENQRILHLHA
ncbi:anaerobic ribonucleoside-triphosphate reductase activating protein [uncultured Ruminococcus sp.]|uniref:anaerobic ribonucleoside-triphosphate reductase activating protein n=1 Tax=uncultured Ruminococcus sp. TaxID=165186 RepID=UPI0025DD9166|nr:anaerobic ribonucleoside-triphosphate reductase activating protein [uncultured Ruminococcus sp.]